MTALQRALALTEVHDVAVRVGEDLDLDVARPLDPALHDHTVVAEGGQRLTLRGGRRFGDLAGSTHHPHALATAAGHGLDHQREPAAVAPRYHRHAGLLGELLGAALVPHQLDRRGRRADPDQPGVDDVLRKLGVLTEEAVTGMDRSSSGAAGRVDDAGRVEVGADSNRLIGAVEVGGAGVRVGEDRDGGEAERAHGTGDPHRDLTAVGDQDRREIREVGHATSHTVILQNDRYKL